jgi:hypothetical protein
MSHSNANTKNKYPKTYNVQYLSNVNEPDDDFQDTFGEEATQLNRQSERYYMVIKKRLRQNAQRMRKQ